MNKVILMGRLTRDPEIRQTQGAESMTIARYTLAVDRRGAKKDGEANADFINIVAFGKAGEFAEKYFRQGMRVLVTGRIQTGSYMNKDGQKVYTTDVVVEDQEFADSKQDGGSSPAKTQQRSAKSGDKFMEIPNNVDEEGLPF